MPADLLYAHLAFHLSGHRAQESAQLPDRGDELPAVFAQHRNLSALRYDFPLVLRDDGGVEALSGLVDRLLGEVATGDDERRLNHHVLRLERRMRQLAELGASGERLSALWALAAQQLQVDREPRLDESLARAGAALRIDGDVVDCDGALPVRLFRHQWRVTQKAKVARFHREVDVLIHGLSDILQADFADSPEGRSAARLRAAVGPIHRGDFDFDAMSRLLARGSAPAAISDNRRRRIESALAVLRDQQFFSTDGSGYAFEFTSCAAARDAFWRRCGLLTELARAVELARFEIAGSRHAADYEPLAQTIEASPVDSASMVSPHYLVRLDADALDPTEQAALMESLAAGLPIKVLLQTNDVLDAAPRGKLHFGFGARGRQLVDVAIGVNEVYVLQAPSSHLFRRIDALRTGFDYAGPALFHVFSGASAHSGALPPYLIAAAALESRAFPIFVYDPSAGPDWASRFSLEGNPQPAVDWPVYRFAYENAAHQAVAEDLAFTLIDFAACDDRYAGHFARVERDAWHEGMAPAAEVLAFDSPDGARRVPFLAAVDSCGRLARLLVEDVLLQQARRCRDRWHSLRELGGIDNSHARRVLAEASAEAGVGAGAKPPVAPGERSGDQRAPESERVGWAAGAKPPGSSEDSPYIETPRCSTCNECIQINDRMFAYNENRQAYIADPSAGTYRQLVEAAESCQVSIIHPGKPRNPAEPGLEELIARAEAFA
jgi:hypothetical protein